MNGRNNNTSEQMNYNIAEAFFNTREAGNLVEQAFPHLTSKWAGTNPLKKIILRFISKGLTKNIQRQNKEGDLKSITDLFNDADFARYIFTAMPGISTFIFQNTSSIASAFNRLDKNTQAELVKKIITAGGIEKSGIILTGICKVLNTIHDEDPLFFSENLKPVFIAFLQNTDFGEIKEALEKSSEDITSIVKMINEELWNYPAKVVAVFSCIPQLINILLGSIYETTAPLNKVSPDLLSDVLLSLLNEIKGEKIAKTINEFSELIRKIHTGSTLLGEAGVPKLSENAGKLTRDIIESLDVSLFIKAQFLLGTIKDDLSQIISNELKKNPAFKDVYIETGFSALTRALKAFSQRVEALEVMYAPHELSEKLIKGVSSIDPQMFAEALNSVVLIVNSIKNESPDLIADFCTQFFDSIDIYEARESAEWLIEGVTLSLKPHAGEIMPPVLKGIAAMIASAVETNKDETVEALAVLHQAMSIREEVL